MQYIENNENICGVKLLFQSHHSFSLPQSTTENNLHIIPIYDKGGLTLNPGYNRVYAPVLRSPLLFHHHSGLYCTTNSRPQPRVVPAPTHSYFLQPTSLNRPQSRYTAQAPTPYSPQSYPYYCAMPKGINPSLMPLPYYIPTVTYASTVSSKGLALILIAILMLVALDLVMVRPQKR